MMASSGHDKKHLRYVILEDNNLKIYDSIPVFVTPGYEGGPTPLHEYVILRKKCLMRSIDQSLQFTLKVQDVGLKFRNKIITFSVPDEVFRQEDRRNGNWILGRASYLRWLEIIKIS